MTTHVEPSSAAEAAVRVEVHGTVQGVGFRPFVYRFARELQLRGEVRNAGGYVVIPLVGPFVAADEFLTRHDLHSGYLSTQHARRWWSTRDRIGVRHHHAHVAATAAEHGVAGPFLGLAYDGLGLGDDGTLWGGELLLCDYTRYRRLGRFGTAPLPGGEAEVPRPARMALGYLFGTEDTSPRWTLRGRDGLWVYDPDPVFQNALLAAALADQDLQIHIGQRVPVNDGGVSYGQATIAAATLNEG